MRCIVGVVVGACILPSGSQALAHARLLEMTPRAQSVVAVSPPELRLNFSEGIEPRFSSVDVTTADGQKIFVGPLAAQGKEVMVPLPKPLAAGVYRVNWHILSADGHKVQGSFTFEVRP
jgi:methionine-rich copper-binding protein CopC